ncbi:hypothetical protein [Bacillus sp. T33-2]|uniref:hypothetical protein n=1 Tax=Bacillus sp. T33-2 TaxID=2054168 RepID=UPI000C775325|nr:hypothetical protein [Bacillus sp. T33-2]PLR98892.1 hypothetical protein CVD19_04485 [Bacillus sp. T33-2]
MDYLLFGKPVRAKTVTQWDLAPKTPLHMKCPNKDFPPKSYRFQSYDANAADAILVLSVII